MIKKLLLILGFIFCSGITSAQQFKMGLIEPPSDCSIGYQKGVSAQFSGTCFSQPIVAGGANFPNTPSAQGGEKAFYKDIYLFSIIDWKWAKIGEMEQPAAYGGTAQVENKLIFVGGANEKGALTTVNAYGYNIMNGQLSCEKLPSLPEPIEQCSAVAIDSTVYVVGGLASGQPSDKIYALNLDDKQWRLLDSRLPAPVIQPLTTAFNNNLYIWGGFSLPQTIYAKGWMLDINNNSWQELPAPKTNNLTGACAFVIDELLMVSGGVNADIFLKALERRQKLTSATGAERDKLLRQEKKYMSMSAGKYKFNDKLLVYDFSRNLWDTFCQFPQLARAGASMSILFNELLVFGGEVKPGIRNPKSLHLHFNYEY